MKTSLLTILIVVLCALSSCNINSKDESANTNNDFETESDVSLSNSVFISESSPQTDGELRLTITNGEEITESFFYATDANGVLYRVYYDDDAPVLSQGLEIYVKFDSIKELDYTASPSGVAPKYEITATYIGLIARPY